MPLWLPTAVSGRCLRSPWWEVQWLGGHLSANGRGCWLSLWKVMPWKLRVHLWPRSGIKQGTRDASDPPGGQGLGVMGGGTLAIAPTVTHTGALGLNTWAYTLGSLHKVIATSSRRGKMMDDVLYLATNAVNLIPSKWANSLHWLMVFMINSLRPSPTLIFNNLVIGNKRVPFSHAIVD